MSLTAAGVWVASMAAGTMLYNKIRHPYTQLERDVDIAMEAAGLLEKNRHHQPIYWKNIKTTKTNLGFELIYKLPNTKTVLDVEKALDRLISALNIQVRVQANDKRCIKLTLYKEPMPTHVMYDEEVLRTCRGAWKFPIGVDNEGWAHWDMLQIPHLLFGGLTGGGKTIFVKVIIATAIFNHAEEVEIWISDLKGGADFNVFAGLPQIQDIVYTAGETDANIDKIINEMESRQKTLRKADCEDINQYNAYYKPMKRILVVIDELAELADEEDLQEKIARITKLGRSVGVHLIAGTQRPDAKTVSRNMKTMMDAVVAFRVRDHHESKILLDTTGAEVLPGIKGRCIFQTDKTRIVQCPYASSSRLQLMFLQYGFRGKRADVETGFKELSSKDESGDKERSRLRLATSEKPRVDED